MQSVTVARLCVFAGLLLCAATFVAGSTAPTVPVALAIGLLGVYAALPRASVHAPADASTDASAATSSDQTATVRAIRWQWLVPACAALVLVCALIAARSTGRSSGGVPVVALVACAASLYALVGMRRPWLLQLLTLANGCLGYYALVHAAAGGVQPGALQALDLPTAGALLMLNAGLLAARGDAPLTALYFSPRAGGRLLRPLLPAAWLLPLAVVLMFRLLPDRAPAAHSGASASEITAIAATLAGFCWLTASAVERSDSSFHRAEAGLHQAFDAIHCGVLVCRPDGRIELANNTAHVLFGYPPGALVDLPVEQLVPTAQRGAHAGLYAGYFARPVDLPMAGRGHLEGRRRDGALFPAAISLSAMKTLRGPRVLATVLDASEQQRTSEQNARMAAIVASSTDAIVAKNMAGVITSWNPAAERIFGYGAAEAIGSPVTMLFTPERLGEESSILARVRRGETVANLQTTRRRKDGAVLEMSISIAPIHDGGGRVVGAAKIARDIGDQRRLQRYAERLAALNAAVVDNMAFAVMTTAPEGIITSFNRAAEDLLGYASGEVVGLQTARIFHDEAEILARARQQSERTGEPVAADGELFVGAARHDDSRDQEWTYVRRDGTRFPGRLSVSAMRDRDGRLIGFLAILTDLSVQRDAEAAAVREREKLQTILDNAIDGIHILDERGQLIYHSQSFARMLGRDQAQMAGLRTTDWDPVPRKHTLEESLQRLAQETDVFETRHRRLDGSWLDVEVSIKAIQLEGRTLLYASARDITERQRIEAEREQYLRQLERTNKDLDEFVSVASHDLRAPLRAANSLAQWIVEDDPSVDAQTRERLGLIQGRMRRMTRLLDDILHYARIGKRAPGAGELLSGTALVGHVLTFLELPLRMRVVLDDSLDDVSLPRMPLQQVFANLIDNAVKHHDRPAGTITVAAERRQAAWHFTVSDDGPGVPEAYRDDIFELFRTLRPRDEVEGSGMGLALVRKIVASAGGRCGVEAAPVRGARFWFDWPDPPGTGES